MAATVFERLQTTNWYGVLLPVPRKRCIFTFLVLRSTSICPVPATVVPSEQVNDPSVSGLEKCFDPKCNEKTDSGSCDGVVGCYWCVRDSNDAPLSKKYCADINTCYGGKEGRLQLMPYCSVCIRSSSVLLLTSDVTVHSATLGSPPTMLYSL